MLKGHHRVPPDQRADAPATADRHAAHGRMVVSDLDRHVDKVADDIAVSRADVRTEQIAQQHRRHRPSVRRPATRGANVSQRKYGVVRVARDTAPCWQHQDERPANMTMVLRRSTRDP